MEDALKVGRSVFETCVAIGVSILVLMEDALKELFLLLDSNDRILHRFLQPLYLKFYPPNRPLFKVFYTVCAHFFLSKTFFNEP